MLKPSFRIECAKRYGFHVLHMPELVVLDESEARGLLLRIEELIHAERSPRIAVSLHDIKLVSTAAWGKFMVLHQGITNQGGRFALIDVSDDLVGVLETMKIAKLLDIRKSADALAEA